LKCRQECGEGILNSDRAQHSQAHVAGLVLFQLDSMRTEARHGQKTVFFDLIDHIGRWAAARYIIASSQRPSARNWLSSTDKRRIDRVAGRSRSSGTGSDLIATVRSDHVEGLVLSYSDFLK
jgi:hypothetical protein